MLHHRHPRQLWGHMPLWWGRCGGALDFAALTRQPHLVCRAARTCLAPMRRPGRKAVCSTPMLSPIAAPNQAASTLARRRLEELRVMGR
jgi:hypothetical protein